MSTVLGLFSGLFDDAALFPPGDAPMTAAVPAHRALREDFGELVGPFIVPAARLDELASCLGDGPPFGISLIAAPGTLPAAAARVAADPRLALKAVKIPVVADAAAARAAVQVLDGALPEGVWAAIEVPRTPSRAAVLDVLVGTGYRAKLALRHTAADTGFEHHGFLNVLLAADALARGASPGAAAECLAQRDGVTVAGQLRTWSPERAERARALFTSFGTCSVLEPVEDLVALRLLPTMERMSS